MAVITHCRDLGPDGSGRMTLVREKSILKCIMLPVREAWLLVLHSVGRTSHRP